MHGSWISYDLLPDDFLSWILAYKDGGILSMGMEASVPLFRRLNENDTRVSNLKPLRGFM